MAGPPLDESRVAPPSGADEHLGREEFERHFRYAVDAAVAFAATLVRQPLPASRRFVIMPNASYDWHPLEDDQQLFPEDSLPSLGHTLPPKTAEEALAWMWRGGKVPEWVDVSVYHADRRHTYLRLVCCGRFTALKRRLYYRWDGGPAPFGVKSPSWPPNLEGSDIDAGARFDLPGHWRARLRRLILSLTWRLRHWRRADA